MDTTILCVGDVVGAPGRRVLAEALPKITAEKNINCNIVNVENAAAGSGLTPALYDKFLSAGVELMTLGDHAYRRKDIIKTLERSDRITRPANLAPGAPGRDFAIWETADGVRVAVFTVLGRLFVRVGVDCPFRAADRVIAAIGNRADVIVAEIHAEATSEKIAIGWYLDGRVSIVFGTHTHVPTADQCILPKGTAYITDLGMTGPYDSVLGRMKERVISAMTTSVPAPFDVAEDDARVCGIVVTVDGTTRRAKSIERLRVDEDLKIQTQ